MNAEVCLACGRPKSPPDCEVGHRTEAELSRPDPIVKRLLWLVGFAFFAAFLSYGLQFFGPLSTEVSVWAQFGDYFGGMLNPVVGLAALIALLETLQLQRRELKASIEELRRTAEAAISQARVAEHQAEIMIRSARIQGLSHLERWAEKASGSNEGRELIDEVHELKRLLQKPK